MLLLQRFDVIGPLIGIFVCFWYPVLGFPPDFSPNVPSRCETARGEDPHPGNPNSIGIDPCDRGSKERQGREAVGIALPRGSVNSSERCIDIQP